MPLPSRERSDYAGPRPNSYNARYVNPPPPPASSLVEPTISFSLPSDRQDRIALCSQPLGCTMHVVLSMRAPRWHNAVHRSSEVAGSDTKKRARAASWANSEARSASRRFAAFAEVLFDEDPHAKRVESLANGSRA